MSLGPLYVVLGEVSVQVLCPFFNWIVCLPGVESCKFFIYILEIRPSSEVSLTNVFPYCWFPLYFNAVFFSHAEAWKVFDLQIHSHTCLGLFTFSISYWICFPTVFVSTYLGIFSFFFFLVFFFSSLFFSIVIQVQFPTFSHHHLPPLQPSPPSTLDPTPLWLSPCVLYTCSLKTLPHFPSIIPFHLPCGYCHFVLYFSVSGYILLPCFFCWLGSTYRCDHMVFVFIAWLLSLHIMLSKSIHTVTKGRNSFFLLCSIPLCKCTVVAFFFKIWFIHF